MSIKLSKKEFELFEVFKELGDESARIEFYQHTFWNKVLVTDNDKVNYKGIFEKSALLLEIFNYVLKQNMYNDCYELSLIAQTATVVNSMKAIVFIKRYDKILMENAPDFKEILGIIR